MNHRWIDALRRDGVELPDDADRETAMAAVQLRVIRVVTTDPCRFDRTRYERLMRAWGALSEGMEEGHA